MAKAWKSNDRLRKRIPEEVPRDENGDPDVESLPPFARNVLLDNPQCSWHWDSDAFVRAVCALEHQLSMSYRRWGGKIYVDPPTGEVVQGRSAKNYLEHTIPWECAICGKSIRSSYREERSANFVCDSCNESGLHLDEKGRVKREVMDSAIRMYAEVRRMYRQRVGRHLNQKNDPNGTGGDQQA